MCVESKYEFDAMPILPRNYRLHITSGVEIVLLYEECRAMRSAAKSRRESEKQLLSL